MTRAEVDQFAEETGVELLLADGFDDAIVGIGRQCNRYFVVYDVDRVIQILVDRDDATIDDALEFFEFNVVGAWVGEHTPCFLTTSLDTY
jgi:hypothetical protein